METVLQWCRRLQLKQTWRSNFVRFSQCFDVRARLVRYAFRPQPLRALLPSLTCMLWCVVLITGLFSYRVAPLTFAVLAAVPPWLLGCVRSVSVRASVLARGVGAECMCRKGVLCARDRPLLGVCGTDTTFDFFMDR